MVTQRHLYTRVAVDINIHLVTSVRMKKTLIIGIATMLLLSASPAYAKNGGHGEKENHERGNKNRVTLDASSTAQLVSIKQQINDLNRQLAELKKNSNAEGKTIHKDDEKEHMSQQGRERSCARFLKEHRKWKWKGHGHRGWWRMLDQAMPVYCQGLPGYGTSTTPVVDVTAPTISGIVVSGISSTSASVNWTTSEGATSKIFLSTSSPVLTTGTPVWTDGATTTSHGVQLLSLIPNTTYYFIVTNKDVANNTATSAQGSFVTASIAVVDATAPIISSIGVSALGNTVATVNWNTNESASSKLFLSTSSPVSTSSAKWTDAGFLTSHSAPLSGLATGTTYYFVISAKDASLNEALSAQGAFTTTNVVPDVTPPIITALSAVPTGSTTATVSWTTSEVADSTVYFSTTSPVVLGTASSVTLATLLTSHSMNLTGLSASSTYYVVVASKDAALNLATSTQTSFATSN